MHTVINSQLVKSTITGELEYAVNIGGIVKYFKNDAGASRYFKKLGYEFETWQEGDVWCGGWIKKKLSDAEVWLKNKFTHF